MKRALILAAALSAFTAISAPAVAEIIPRAGPSDPRVRVVDYDPNDVVSITGTFRTATQVIFGANERILHVALGDTVAWEVAAQENVLFLKPTEPHQPTNLIVSTRKGTELRNYTFELTARPGSIGASAPNTFFQVRFRYPEDERARAELERLSQAASQAAEIETKIVDLELGLGVLEGPRNFAYSGEGSSALQPSEISDNGRFTVMRFPANQALPSIFTVTPDGTESVVPFDVRGEFVVIHATVPQLRLRRGREVLCIFNEAYNPYGTSTGTNTVSRAVERTTAPEGQR